MELKFFDEKHCVLSFNNKDITINEDGIFVNGKKIHYWN